MAHIVRDEPQRCRQRPSRTQAANTAMDDMPAWSDWTGNAAKTIADGYVPEGQRQADITQLV